MTVLFRVHCLCAVSGAHRSNPGRVTADISPVTWATTIEFDATSQQWKVRDTGGALLHSHPSREVCLAWEHRHFNQ